jgi:phage terminase small subunit
LAKEQAEREQRAAERTLRLKSRPLSKRSAAKLRKKPIASAARQSNANRPAWLRRSAKQMSRRDAKPTLSTARL